METDETLASLKQQLNQVRTENVDLRAEIVRLRYLAHPANDHVNAEQKEETLKVQINHLANENDDLKSVVGKMRYTNQPGNIEEQTAEGMNVKYFRRIVQFGFVVKNAMPQHLL